MSSLQRFKKTSHLSYTGCYLSTWRLKEHLASYLERHNFVHFLLNDHQSFAYARDYGVRGGFSSDIDGNECYVDNVFCRLPCFRSFLHLLAAREDCVGGWRALGVHVQAGWRRSVAAVLVPLFMLHSNRRMLQITGVYLQHDLGVAVNFNLQVTAGVCSTYNYYLY